MSNQPYLAVLAKDCPNTRNKKVHEHMTIGFDKDLKTSEVSAYSRGWCRAYAKALKEFVEEPVDKRCVHCLPQGEAKMIYNRREAVRRCAEVVGLGDLVDDLRYGFGQDRGEVFLTAVQLEPPEKAAFVQTHLGARCVGAPDSSVQAYPVSKNSEISQTTGSESFEQASRALRDTAKRCGKLCAHRLSDPQLPCASPEAALRKCCLMSRARNRRCIWKR